MGDILAGNRDERKVGKLPYGAYSKIARRMRPTVSAQMVRAVWLGQAKSARVSAAIARYVESLERSAAA